MSKSKKAAKRRAGRILVCVLTLLLLIGLGIFIYYAKRLKIDWLDTMEVNVNEAVDNYQMITSLENGAIVTERAPIDTAKVGQVNVSLTVKPVFGKEAVFSCLVSVVDRESPVITFADHVEVDLGGEIDLLSGVMVTDNSGEAILPTVEGDYDLQTPGAYTLRYVACDSSANQTEETFVLSVVDREPPVITCKEKLETTKGKAIDLLAGVSAADNSGEEITVTVEGSYNFDKAGSYSLQYVAMDSSLNKTEVPFTLRVKEPVVATPAPEAAGETVTFTTSKGYSGVTVNGITYIEGYLVANKTYALPKSYGNGLTSETQTAFNAMAAAAKQDGLNIYISSGYRSYSTQSSIYSRYVNRDGVEKADTYSARPGHSEHQSGLAFDVNIINDSFIGTPEAIWLADHCQLYGFILRYPQGKTNETGYKYEPWHFRYVGTELAAALYNNGDWITMEDYFGITSQYQ